VARALLDLVTVAGFVAIAVAAVLTYRTPQPPPPSRIAYAGPIGSSYNSLVALALTDYAANNAGAKSAPQQQVVNGWAAKDLLTIAAHENADVIEGFRALGTEMASLPQMIPAADDRVPAFALLAVFGICWFGVTGCLRSAFRG
jgi:hypothetical protein